MGKKVLFMLVTVLLICNVCFWGKAEEGRIEFSPTYLNVIDKLEGLTPGRTITVNMGVQKERYKAGETFEIRFEVSKDCYITLMYLNSTGTIWFLIPNHWNPAPKIEGKRVYSTWYHFNVHATVVPPLTVDVFNLFCSPEKLDLLETDLEKDPFYTIHQDDEEQLTKLLDRLNQLQAIEWSGNSITIMTGAARGLSVSRKIGAIPSTGSGDFFPPLDLERTPAQP
jgi:hypothetical protein